MSSLRARLVAGVLGLVLAGPALGADTLNPPPKPSDWSALARLPDWSGSWIPDVLDQNAQIASNPPPWKPEVAKQVARLVADEKAGNPKGLFVDCLPHGMPALMLKSHNPIEFLFTPGRVTLLGESDGNRLRRIFTDGRGHPDDPDPSFFGHSIGRWEGCARAQEHADPLKVRCGTSSGGSRRSRLHPLPRYRAT